MGTETEFGITVQNQPDVNPVHASSQVINAYAGSRARVRWSYEDEAPGRDARGPGYETIVGGDFESGLVNTVLTNGARFYVDHAHPEYSSPECYDPLEAALYDKAGEFVLAEAARAAQALLAEGQRLLIHKNNSDGKGNSYGAHENILLSRETPFRDLVGHLLGFLATRQIYTGAGKVGAENGRPQTAYQITQRADFFEEQVGLETTLKRPIVNTRDEPHAEPGSYRRLHVIIGDATISETQTFLKLGSLSMFLAAVEDGALPPPPGLSDPVASVWKISHDPTLRTAVALSDGTTITALDLQWRYLGWVREHATARGIDEVHRRVLDTWEQILADLERDPLSTADRLDWTAKLQLLEGFRERDHLPWNHPKLRLLDLQYHDVDPARGLYHRLVGAGRMQRLFTDDQVHRAAVEPPARTRAYFRGTCVERFGRQVVAANWDSMIFDVGEDTLRRVPMMEPLRGRKDLVGDLIASSGSAAELVRALGGDHG
ncbi:MAG: proteasome accessory factor PafA2 [Actinobacteria bacterium]|nr:proteasome accessory factor PafA2 [Actinomycetota bacterium]MBU1493663.1 proteasome accessory factor PafA2 [Actinomycetota bacterium]